MLMSMTARFLARPAVAAWLVERSLNTPYSHVRNTEGELYMKRYWLFNPYPTSQREVRWWKTLLPSVRVHHIVKADDDLHDHPWDARTFILRGWYREEREVSDCRMCRTHFSFLATGQTAKLRFGEYHRISAVSNEGAWTIFVTFKKKGSWNFKVDGKVIPWRDYLKGKEQK